MFSIAEEEQKRVSFEFSLNIQPPFTIQYPEQKQEPAFVFEYPLQDAKPVVNSWVPVGNQQYKYYSYGPRMNMGVMRRMIWNVPRSVSIVCF